MEASRYNPSSQEAEAGLSSGPGQWVPHELCHKQAGRQATVLVKQIKNGEKQSKRTLSKKVACHGTFPPWERAIRASSSCWLCPHPDPISSAYLQEGIHLLLDPVHKSPLDDQAVREKGADSVTSVTHGSLYPGLLLLGWMNREP